MIEPYASKIPNYVGLGNHENCVPEDRMPPGRVPYLYNWTDSGGECGVPTNFHLPMPWKNLDETWYAAEVHPRISVVMMSSEHNYLPGSKQLEELDDLLKSIRDKRGPKHHIVFLNHRPAYINSEYPGDTKWSGDQRVASMLREFVEPLFRRYVRPLIFRAPVGLRELSQLRRSSQFYVRSMCARLPPRPQLLFFSLECILHLSRRTFLWPCTVTTTRCRGTAPHSPATARSAPRPSRT